MHEAEAAALAAAAESGLEGAHDADLAQRGNLRPQVKGDMAGMPTREALAAGVGDARMRSAGSSGAGPASAP